MEAVECGAAALGILLGYYGCFASLEELRINCGVSRDGVSAHSIIQAAKYYGLEGDAYYTSWEDLKELKQPAILYWEQNHFLVLEKMRGESVWINDPATGPRKIHLNEFKKSYSGVVLVLKPGPKFAKRGEDISFRKRLSARFTPVLGKLSYLFLIDLVTLLFTLSLPAIAKIFIDTFLKSELPSWKGNFLWFIVLILFAATLVTWIRGRFVNRLLVGLSIKFNTQFVHHILSLPISFFSQRYPGELLNRILLNTRLASVFTEGFVSTIVSLIMIVVYGAILFFYNQLIASVGMAAALFNIILLYWINRTRVNAYARLQQEEFKTIGISFDTIENIETMKSVSNDTFFFSRIAGHYTNSVNALQSIGRKDAFLIIFSNFSVQLTNVLLLAIGAWVVMQGELTIGMLFAFQILMNFFLRPFSALVQFGADYQSLKVDVARVDDVLQHPIDPLMAPREEELPPSKLKGEVVFKNVSFGYAPLDPPFLKEFSLKVDPGELVGIVGPVGSGKSTVARLGSALHQPWSGDVLFDGKKAVEQVRSTLKRSVSSVDQEIKLFAGTLYENIALWDPSVTENMVIEAAKRAALHEDIIRFPSGYHTRLKERGTNLSQGQKQRLELARAFLYEPSVLILDETLNSVDSETEAEIFSHMRSLGCTVILISHRLSTVRKCDRIVAIENGRLVGEGTHEELVKSCELYRQLCSFEK